jgi:hypothetical protein
MFQIASITTDWISVVADCILALAALVTLLAEPYKKTLRENSPLPTIDSA